jgi:hypothetical protein
MDRRSFLKGLAAIGLIPAVDIERILAQPEAVEPSPLASDDTFRVDAVPWSGDGPVLLFGDDTIPVFGFTTYREPQPNGFDETTGGFTYGPGPVQTLDIRTSSVAALQLRAPFEDGDHREVSVQMNGTLIRLGKGYIHGIEYDSDGHGSVQVTVWSGGPVTRVPWAK